MRFNIKEEISPHIILENNFETFKLKQISMGQSLNLFQKPELMNENDIILPIDKSSNLIKISPPIKSRKTINKELNSSSIIPLKKRTIIQSYNMLSPKNLKSENKLHLTSEKKKSFYDIITNFYLIKKFVTILMTISTLRKPKFLNKRHYELINDRCVVNDNNSKIDLKQNSLFFSFLKKSISKLISCLFLKIKVFPPFYGIFMFMNGVDIILYSFFLFLLPIILCFNIDLSNNEFELFNLQYNHLIVIIFFIQIFEILINFNKAFYSKGELIIDKALIASFYLKNYFLLDFISFLLLFSTILYDSIIGVKESKILFLMLYLCFKRKKILNIIKEIEELFIVDQTYFNIYELIKLFTRIIIIAHFAACIWYSISENNIDGISWVQKLDIVDSNWKIKYMHSFYFIIITMNTVGYGDITPQNPKEIIFCIFFVFLACSLFAYCINCVGTIFKEIHQRESGFRADLFSINEFMRNKKISRTLQMRIRKYLEYIWKEEKTQNIEFSNKVIHKLSHSLRSDLMFEANGPYISKIDLFTKNFSEKSLKLLIDNMIEERYTPNELIFEKGDSNNHDMFIIKKGNVQIYVENELSEEKKILMTLGPGKLFGEISFFSEMERSASIKSTDFTTLIRINQEKFKQIIKENTYDYQKFTQMKDSINFYNKYDLMHINCYSCNRCDHLIINCPLLQPNFYNHIIISKYNYSEPQNRSIKKRKVNRSINALICHKFNDNTYFSLNFKNSLSEFENSENDTGNQTDEKTIDNENLNQDISEHSLFHLDDDADHNEEKLKNNIENSLKNIQINNIKNKIQTFETEKISNFNNSNSIDEHSKKSIQSKDIQENTLKKFIKQTSDIKNKKNNDEIFLFMDSVKIFSNYFPHNNVNNIVYEINYKTLRSLKRKKINKSFVIPYLSNFSITNNNIEKSILLTPPKKNILKKIESFHDWKDEIKKIRFKKKTTFDKSNIWKILNNLIRKKLFSSKKK